jgi:hypothetical protein
MFYSNKEDRTMRHVRIKHALLVMVAVFLIVGVTLPSGICYAQKRAKGEWAFPEYYPKKFDGEGYIDRIAKDEIVIDDCSYRFSSFVKFATPTRKNTLRSRFRAGDLVGYIINSKKEIESLWLLKK